MFFRCDFNCDHIATESKGKKKSLLSNIQTSSFATGLFCFIDHIYTSINLWREIIIKTIKKINNQKSNYYVIWLVFSQKSSKGDQAQDWINSTIFF